MDSNRLVLRPTHNRLPLKDVSSQKFSSIEITNKTKFISTTIVQQENQVPTATRPILTAARAIKQYSKENENDMVISPMFKTDFFIEQQPSHS
ncbi:unnamed protein product, partial [Rotaria magnacalcarata]